ncbi:RNA polymerase sigma factor [Chitinophaga japonensis]|uniref:RNA polymerase sigma factor n=1 Tax=Chitinophaga japonensis TaxID=104662 RepID=A0A562T407_CHIJA|nr:sigma-70 family RNA polymerase sigma factor [Chitinophaga japonensis]TWI87974.1 RNA polymerase sigma-70 factor (ECF subfamily) [Chitinophaga japonensis]
MQPDANTPQQIVDHLFRHESGKMIAVLTRIFGIHNLSLVEDVVQEAFLKAMLAWTFKQVPDNPSAWLMTVARNKALDIIRRQQHFRNLSGELAYQLQHTTESTVRQLFLDTEITDSQLRMIFACCHPSLKEEDQIALTLKTVSGFSAEEIARALVTNEAVIQKRLYRARQFIKEQGIQLEIPCGDELTPRLETVYTVLYLLFNEGYNSLKADELIREDLCIEAMRLCLLLSEHKVGRQPATFALLSLMCLQASRFDSRMDENNGIILLQHQDRSTWNRELINTGYHYLRQSSSGDRLTVYHIESAIAAEHCLAPSFEATNWNRMLQLYSLLLEHKPMPVVLLNRAIVLAQLGQHAEAIREVTTIPDIEKLLSTHYIYSAVLGDLYLQAGDMLNARKHLRAALQLTVSLAEKKLIHQKLETINY